MNRLESLPLLVDRQPAELLVHDATEQCPYLPGRMARMPLRLPVRPLTPSELDQRLERGDRRHGSLFYRPTCEACQACEAIRIDTELFEVRRTHKRVLKRGDQLVKVVLGPPLVSPERVELYDRHRFGRGLAKDGSPPMDAVAYQRFLVDRYCDAFELRYYVDDELVGVAVTDRGAESLSAVYCYYDPALSHLSLGTYSILKQIELSRRWNLRFLYLGLYIAGCDAMTYKTRFLPHQRRIDGKWVPFTKLE